MRSATAKLPLLALLASTFAGCSGGCGSQTVLVPPGQPVRIAQPVIAKVDVPDGHGGWVVSPNAVQIPAGWYAVPPPTTQP